ncbi:MAG: hypothetical protein HFH90_05505 [Lachnospiraceae bacterium]|nr:hypothetical protein [Lachnospiraceae bacterium]
MRHVSGKVALEAERPTPACRAADFIRMYRGMPENGADMYRGMLADAGKRCRTCIAGCRKTVPGYRRMLREDCHMG